MDKPAVISNDEKRNDIPELKKAQARTAADYDEDTADAFASSLLPTSDDPSTPSLTLRALVIGMFWAVFLACCNSLFNFRTSPFVVPSAVATLLSYPMGIFFARILPDTKIFGISLNPGPFSIKEHVLISSLAASAGGKPYGLNNVVAQYFGTLIDDKNINFYNSLAWIFCTQLIGYGLAGLCRRFLVKPKAMLWPGIFPQIALYASFHGDAKNIPVASGMTRYGMFWLVCIFMSIYHWLPNFFATGLSAVSVLCLLTTSKTMRFLGSSRAGEGVGLFALTFDWSRITLFYNPLTQPLWATVNCVVAYTFWGYIFVPLMYYFNPLGSPTLQSAFTTFEGDSPRQPFGVINRQFLYDKTGTQVFVKRGSLLNSNNNNLNMTVFEERKPIWLTAGFGTFYFSAFINIGAVISHVYLWYGSALWAQMKSMVANQRTDKGNSDLQNKLMSRYRDIPDWIYAAWLGAMLGLAFVVTGLTPFKLPIWGPLFGLFVGFIYVVPVGILTAISGYQPGLNIITQLLMGYILPGKTIENMVFKSFGYNIMIQALDLVADLKVGHYMCIPPIYMVASQFIGTVIGVVCNTGVSFFVMDNMTNLLLTNSDWGYSNARTFTSAGGIWGAIGPARFFGWDTPYWWTIGLGIPLGIALPFIPWLLNRFRPSKYWYLINIPLLTHYLGGQGYDDVAVVVPLIIALYFNYHLFRNHKSWWDSYTFVIAVGCDVGVAIATLLGTMLLLNSKEYATKGYQMSGDYGTYYCHGDTFATAVKAADMKV